MAAQAWRNRFIVCRHGESEANVQEIIASGEHGLSAFGLTERGRQQAAQAADALADMMTKESSATAPRFISSDFLRAKQTANILAEKWSTTVTLDPRLRERWFGDFDEKASENYLAVWDEDSKDATHTKFNVESVISVAKRTYQLVTELDAQHEGETLVLVAHGDTLQILQTWSQDMALTQHRSVEYLGNAVIREVISQGSARQAIHLFK
eukprot:m.17798 g.17798  ORF g.17798 m.17798 type:complete len:210 (-) comp8367_c0_seq1:202-831(-)